MPTILFQNPYNNTGPYPQQPSSSVDNTPSLTETAGLNPYNFIDFGAKYNEYNLMQQIHRNVPYVDPLQHNIRDPTNILPQLMPLYYKPEMQNFRLFNNPFPQNENIDMKSTKTYIHPTLTEYEGWATVSPVMVGLQNSKTPLGPVYM